MADRRMFMVGLTTLSLLWMLGASELRASDPPSEGEESSVSVRLYLSEGALPSDDPLSSAWDSVPASEFKLAPQVHWQDRIQEATVFRESAGFA